MHAREHLEPDVRQPLRELGGERRQELERDARRRRDADDAARRGVAAFGGALDLAGPLRHARGGRDHALAERREHDAFHAADEERLAERRFELGEAAARRRLRDLQALCRSGDALPLGHGEEELHVVPGDMH